MPRRQSNGVRAEYQWFGGTRILAVETTASTSVGEVIQLRPAHTSLDADRSVVMKRLILTALVHRVDTDEIDGFNFAVALQQTDSSGNLTDVLEIQSGDAFVGANKAIVHWGCLPVPANVWNGSSGNNQPEPSGEGLCREFDIGINRRVDLARTALTLTTAADLSGMLRVFYTWRLLVRTS